jgi:hypothetical protein
MALDVSEKEAIALDVNEKEGTGLDAKGTEGTATGGGGIGAGWGIKWGNTGSG